MSGLVWLGLVWSGLIWLACLLACLIHIMECQCIVSAVRYHAMPLLCLAVTHQSCIGTHANSMLPSITDQLAQYFY